MKRSRKLLFQLSQRYHFCERVMFYSVILFRHTSTAPCKGLPFWGWPYVLLVKSLNLPRATRSPYSAVSPGTVSWACLGTGQRVLRACVQFDRMPPLKEQSFNSKKQKEKRVHILYLCIIHHKQSKNTSGLVKTHIKTLHFG